MYLKLLSLTALASYVAAQEVQDLNATLWANNETSSLAAFLNQSPILIQALSEASNVTILAPNNEAFETLLNGTAGEELYSDPGLSTELLLYHILNGTYAASDITNTSTFIHTFSTNASYTNVTGGQVVQAVTIGEDVVFYSGMLQNATVITPDLNFSGGVIHVVDSVLTLPESAISTARSANLTSLAGALNSTDLIEAVDTAEDVTIFAPTNEAFQNIGSALADLSTEDLASILQYHVVSGTVGYSSMLENMALETLNGEDLTITIIDDTVFVNAARVVATDILVANGVVHIIDNVLNPEEEDDTPEPDATSGAVAFPSATRDTEPPFTSDQPAPTTTVDPDEEGAGPASSASPTSSGLAAPMRTGAVGMGALFGAGAALMNM